MTTRSLLPTPVLALTFALALAACASSAPESEASGPEVSAPASEGEPAASTASAPVESAPADPQPPAGEAGTFTVNETQFAVTFLNRCIPFSDQPGNIDLQPIAQGQGAQLNLELFGDSVDVSVQGSAIEEEFGSLAFGEDPVVHESTVSGDRWTGSATVGDSLGSGETVDISWDVMVPSEAQDCSL
jgi:hypothetical protein